MEQEKQMTNNNELTPSQSKVTSFYKNLNCEKKKTALQNQLTNKCFSQFIHNIHQVTEYWTYEPLDDIK